jgi:hypothetical protein
MSLAGAGIGDDQHDVGQRLPILVCSDGFRSAAKSTAPAARR